MKRVYLILTLTIVLVAALVALSFLFLEREKHRLDLYTIEMGGEAIGYVQTDRYITEDKIVYKSAGIRPKALEGTIINEKAVFDRKSSRMESYVSERKNFGAVVGGIYVKNASAGTGVLMRNIHIEAPVPFDFLAKSGSKFSAVSGVTGAKDTSVFDEKSILSYAAIVDKYDFTRGSSQSFNVLSRNPGLFPPSKTKVTFTSIRDEYIAVGGKKQKTEVLVVRARALPVVYVWVSKKDRAIVQLLNRGDSTLIKRAQYSQKIKIKGYKKEDASYKSQDVLFPSGDIALGATLAVPRKEGKLASVLLIPGEGPFDRDMAGIYTGISDALARRGFMTMRYDKRGIAKSQGDFAATSIADDMSDMANALKFLAGHERVDKEKVFAVAFSGACSFLAQLDFSAHPVRGIVLLSAVRPYPIMDFECEYGRDILKTAKKADELYHEILEKLKTETLNLVKDPNKEYGFVQGRHVFMRRMNELLAFNPLDGFKKLRMPILIIQGEKDRFASPEYIKDIGRISADISVPGSSTVSFRNLGHFLGELTDRENTVKHYEVAGEVLETMEEWLNARMAHDLTKPELYDTLGDNIGNIPDKGVKNE